MLTAALPDRGKLHIAIRLLSATLLIAASLGSLPAYGYPPLIEQAFANMGDKYNWSFTVTTSTQDGSRIEQHQARGGESLWTLVEVDGEAPGDKARVDYQQRKLADAAERGPRTGNGFDSLAQPDSFELVSDSGSHAVYSFQPAPDSDDEVEMTTMLRGLMTINKAGPYVESFQMTNRGKLKPAPMVRIHSLAVDMQFGPAAEGGPYVPVANTTVIEGKMAGIKKIRQNTSIVYSDYQPASVGEAAD